MPGADDKDGPGGIGRPDGTDGAAEGSGIVWLEDGEVRSFEPLPERRRPWLEESFAWGAGDSVPRKGPSDDGSEPPQLIWL